MTAPLIKASRNSLSQKLENINTMKWILNIEENETELTEDNLQKGIDDLIREDYTRIPILCYYLNQMPLKVKNCIKKLLDSKNDTRKCQILFDKFKNEFKHNASFKDFGNYILIHMSQDALMAIKGEGMEHQENALTEAFLDIKEKYYAIIYNITSSYINEVIKMDAENFAYNFPLLINWLNENKSKAIKKLTDDDCEIIAGIFYGLSPEKLMQLNLTSSSKNYEAIEEIIQQLPVKFQVENNTQVIFKLAILKPFMWTQESHEEIVRAIKSINKA